MPKCADCDTEWPTTIAADACDCGEELDQYSPSRGRVSYVVGYD